MQVYLLVLLGLIGAASCHYEHLDLEKATNEGSATATNSDLGAKREIAERLLDLYVKREIETRLKQLKQQERSLFDKLKTAAKDVIGGKDVPAALGGLMQEASKDEEVVGAVKGAVKDAAQNTDIVGAVKGAAQNVHISQSGYTKGLGKPLRKKAVTSSDSEAYDRRGLFDKIVKGAKDVAAGKDIGEVAKGVVADVLSGKDHGGSSKGKAKQAVKENAQVKDTEEHVESAVSHKEPVDDKYQGLKDMMNADRRSLSRYDHADGSYTIVKRKVKEGEKAVMRRRFDNEDGSYRIEKREMKENMKASDNDLKKRMYRFDNADGSYRIEKRGDTEEVKASGDEEEKKVSQAAIDKAKTKIFMFELYHQLNGMQTEILDEQLNTYEDKAKEAIGQLDKTCKQIMPLFETKLNLRRRRRSAEGSMLDNIGGGVDWRKLISLCALHTSHAGNGGTDKKFEEVAKL